MYSIIAAMKYWVTNPSFKVDTNILARMDQFAMSIQSPQTMEKMAKQLHLAVTEHVWFQCFRQPLILSHCLLLYL